MLKIKKINKLSTELPKKSAFTIETDVDFPKLHTLCIASGKRGGGKSVSIANLIRKAKDKGYYDRVLLISPTYMSNKEIWNIAKIGEEDVFEPTRDVLRTIVKFVEAERKEWDDFLHKKDLQKKFQSDMKNKHIGMIDPMSLLDYYENGFFQDAGKPEPWKYSIEQPPRIALIIDDCLGTPLLACSTAGLTNLCIKHRHVGDGLGISIFLCVQSFSCHGGLDRAIRENCTMLMLFKISDENQIKKIREESDLPVTNEEFQAMCKYCHSEPYNFLLIDFSPKTPCKRFRSGWDSYIQVPSIPCLCPKINEF